MVSLHASLQTAILEMKRTSITRLKRECRCLCCHVNILEMKRTSITRLKLEEARAFNEISKGVLEMKRTSITRLKQN